MTDDSHNTSPRAPESNCEVQVGSAHYEWDRYDKLRRWKSYWFQIHAIAKYHPRRVLEVGCGSGVLAWYLRDRLGLKVTTFDVDERLGPDVVGDLRALRDHFDADSFDCVVAFQVLEHLPYAQAMQAFQQMVSVSRGNIIVSLPCNGYPLEVRVNVLRRAWSWSFASRLSPRREWAFDGEHYWELGTKQHPISAVRRDVEQHADVLQAYFCPENSYHYFLECRVRE